MISNKKRAAFLVLLSFFALFTTLLPAFTKPALAASASWVDKNTISYDGVDYEEARVQGKTSFIRKGDVRDLCAATLEGQDAINASVNDYNKYGGKYGKSIRLIRDISGDRKKANHITYEIVTYAALSPNDEVPQEDLENDGGRLKGGFYGCKEIDKDKGISLSDTAQSTAEFTWMDSAQIKRTEGNSIGDRIKIYKKDSQNRFVWEQDPGDCKEYITITGGSASGRGTLFHNGGDPVADGTANGTCDPNGYDTESISIARTRNATAPANSDPDGQGAGTTGVDNDPPSCEEGGGEMSWLLCPAIRLLSGFIQAIDGQIQDLLVVPNKYFDEGSASELRETWARLRNLAYIILVPIMLVMVIGTALGYSVVDAYTVKRAMPRLVIAVLFMTLSYDLMRFMIILTNNVGSGILGLMTSSMGRDSITLASLFDPGGAAGGVFTLLVIPAAGLALVGFILVALSYALVAAIGILIGFLALAFRQMLLILFMLLAPLAILAWIFPGNDKLWKLWWGSFTKLLYVYPIIMLMIGGGKVFAVVVQEAEGSGPLETMLILTAYIAPYFFIPVAFKAAGGLFATITGMAGDRSRGIFDRQRKFRQRQASQNWDRKVGRRADAKRADWQNRLQGSNSMLVRAGGRAIGGYNIQAKASARQAQIGKELNDQIATGRDEEIRGLTVNKAAAEAKGALALDTDGHMSNGLMRINKDTKLKEYKTLAGAWVNEGAVNAGHARWGKDVYAQQAALSYEMRKAMTDDQVQDVSDRYADLALNQWGMTDNQTQGAWIGAAFENQNQHIEYKNTELAKDKVTGKLTGGPAKINAKKLAEEVYEKKGTYQLSQMSGHTIKKLKEAYDTGDAATKEKVQLIAENFMYRGGPGGSEIVDADGTTIPATPRPAGTATAGTPMEPVFQTNTPGAAAVAERVRDLAVHVGVYRPEPLGRPKDRSAGPPPDIPRLS